MTITGKNLIAGQFTGDFSNSFTSFNVLSNKMSTQYFVDASTQHVDLAIEAAQQAFNSYSQLPAIHRAKFLRSIGEQILALDTQLISTASQETGLPEARLIGERARTVNQLNLFADLLTDGEYQAVIELADQHRQPLAKPDLRLGSIPLGVVAVFGASNFPLAFSTAGGDTASALAAGCPVVMKAHPAHPATAELVAQAILSAINLCGVAPGVFSLIQGQNYAIASQIVTHPLIKAVGFTGSERVGMILQRQIFDRAEPIPFYGELGSTNPQFILPHQLALQASELAQQLVASMLMGQGQFCTSPGVWLLPSSEHSQQFMQAAQQAITQQQAGTMLTPEIAKGFEQSAIQWRTIAGVELIGEGNTGACHESTPLLFACDVATYLANPILQQEVFGACALIVRCDNVEQMLMFVQQMHGNLTASVHATDDDLEDAQQLVAMLVHKVGRIIYNQMPTGVEVSAAMHHGGPFPASTDVRTSSVGSSAIKRFQRPICYQNMPSALLPTALRS
jgi:2,5-dioxopentanoate dehydrogenase